MGLPRYTIRQLDAYLAVADALSFTDAGNRLGLTPSAVSQLVLELETEVGFKLFDRSTRKVTLSSAGKEFLAPAGQVMRHLRLAEMAAADLRSGSAGLVRVAASMVIASSMLPGLIRAHMAEQPQVTVRIRDAAVEQLVEMVEAGDADIAMGPDRSCGDNVRRIALFESPWVLWCAPSHPLAQKDTLSWDDLRGVALVAAGRDHEFSVQKMRAGLPAEERIVPIDVVDNVLTALGIAAEGLAATLMPAYVSVWAERLGLVMRRVLEPEAMRQVCLYLPTRRAMSPSAQGFAGFIAGGYGVDIAQA